MKPVCTVCAVLLMAFAVSCASTPAAGNSGGAQPAREAADPFAGRTFEGRRFMGDMSQLVFHDDGTMTLYTLDAESGALLMDSLAEYSYNAERQELDLRPVCLYRAGRAYADYEEFAGLQYALREDYYRQGLDAMDVDEESRALYFSLMRESLTAEVREVFSRVTRCGYEFHLYGDTTVLVLRDVPGEDLASADVYFGEDEETGYSIVLEGGSLKIEPPEDSGYSGYLGIADFDEENHTFSCPLYYLRFGVQEDTGILSVRISRPGMLAGRYRSEVFPDSERADVCWVTHTVEVTACPPGLEALRSFSATAPKDMNEVMEFVLVDGTDNDREE